MNNLEKFMEMLCGDFQNNEQCRLQEESGKRVHPYARHKIEICNDRIINLPADFPGYFVIERSHFTLEDKIIEKEYLFLYEEDKNGNILLTSYNVPEGLKLDYSTFTVSPRFQPLTLRESEGEFFGENVSQFSEKSTFIFSLKVTPSCLFVKELLVKADGSRIAGYEDPIIYKRA